MNSKSIKTIYLLWQTQNPYFKGTTLTQTLNLPEAVQTFHFYDKKSMIHKMTELAADALILVQPAHATESTTVVDSEISFLSEYIPFFKISEVKTDQQLEAELKKVLAEVEKIEKKDHDLIFNRVSDLISETNSDVIQEISQLFIKNKEVFFQGIPTEISPDYVEKMKFQAHKIKSSSLNLGSQKLGQITYAIEDMKAPVEFEKLKVLISLAFKKYDFTIHNLSEYFSF